MAKKEGGNIKLEETRQEILKSDRMAGNKSDRMVGKKWREISLIVNEKAREIESDAMIRTKRRQPLSLNNTKKW